MSDVKRYSSKFLTILLLTAAAITTLADARADFPTAKETRSSKPYPTVEITALTFTEPRPLRAWVVEIDLTSPDLDIQVTPRGKFTDKRFETASATTLDFAKDFGLQLAINATPFSPIRTKSGEGVDVMGLSMSAGDLYSSPAAKFGALVFDAKHQARLLPPPIESEQLKDMFNAVGGYGTLLTAGKNVSPEGPEPGAKVPLHPRTAVGLSADRKTMWWLIVDGRQKGVSEGVCRPCRAAG